MIVTTLVYIEHSFPCWYYLLGVETTGVFQQSFLASDAVRFAVLTDTPSHHRVIVTSSLLASVKSNSLIQTLRL